MVAVQMVSLRISNLTAMEMLNSHVVLEFLNLLQDFDKGSNDNSMNPCGALLLLKKKVTVAHKLLEIQNFYSHTLQLVLNSVTGD